MRRDGELVPVDEHPPLTDADLEAALQIVSELTPARRESFYESGELDIAYTSEDLPRFRVNAFRQRGVDLLRVPRDSQERPQLRATAMPPGVRAMADAHRGLVLVTGATGSGKTTTLAAIIDHINKTRRQHIVTIEDPIEILHEDHACIVNQREVGIDTIVPRPALRRALRQDPDVILIGELRDAERCRDGAEGGGVGSPRLLDHAHDRRGRDPRPDDRVLPGQSSRRRSARSSPECSAASSASGCFRARTAAGSPRSR